MTTYSGTVAITVSDENEVETELEVTATYTVTPGRRYGYSGGYPDDHEFEAESIVIAATGEPWAGTLTEEDENEVIDKLIDRYHAAEAEHAECEMEWRREMREER